MKNNRSNSKRLLILRSLAVVFSLFFAGTVPAQQVAPFISTWQTDGGNNIVIPLAGGGYDFSINWGDGAIETKTDAPGNITHTYAASGTYAVAITSNTLTGFPRIYINYFGNRDLLQTISQWGGGKWSSMERAFLGATQLKITATDAPDLLLVSDFSYMFQDCTSLTGGPGINSWRFTTDHAMSVNMTSMFQSTGAFNLDISSWNMERVTNMNTMFYNAQAFNQSLSAWNVSAVTDMSSMFQSTVAFNQPLAWGATTANVINMNYMFYSAQAFNQDLSSWDVSSVTSMVHMFSSTLAFNQPLAWGATTKNLTNTNYMFYNSQAFNQDLSSWDVSRVTNMDNMFSYARVFNSPLLWGAKTATVQNMNSMFREAPAFNQDINGWDVSNVTSTNLMFYRTNSFNQDLNSWNLASLTNATQMFQDNTSFNGDISGWRFTTDIAKSIDMNSMFQSTTAFDRNISSWNVERVNNMSNMFNNAQAFNQNLSAWDVSAVTNMTSMFQSTLVFNQPLTWGAKTAQLRDLSYMFNNAQAFNQDISGWNLASVTNMNGMFQSTKTFNQDLSGWDVSSVISMSSMFFSSEAFNQPLAWGATTANVINMNYMFYNAQAFNQDLSSWDVSRVTNMDNMFAYARVFNGPLLWGAKTASVQNMNSMFREAPAFNQDINGWDVSNVTSTNLMFYRTNSFNQDLNSWNFASLTNATQMFQDNTSFNGDISGWRFTTDIAKSIDMNSMFQSTTAFDRNISSWNVERVNNMSNMFNNAQAFNQNLSAWDVSAVTNMTSMFQSTLVFNQPLTWGAKTAQLRDPSYMFNNAQAFNQDISGWNLASVTNMNGMFQSTKTFNQNLSGWDVSSVTSMSSMFFSSEAFNQPLAWGATTANVINMNYMFYNAQAFNQDLSSWDVSRVTNMDNMFAYARVFNSPLLWGAKTASVQNMNSMFREAPAFNQNISNWDISGVNNVNYFMLGKKLYRPNYDSLLLGWAELSSGESQVPANQNIHFGTSKYSNDPAVITARAYLTDSKNWVITDGGMETDISAPTISNALIAFNDSTITVTFNERVYNSYTAVANLDTTAFLFSITGGTATLSSTTPISILTTDNISFTLGIGLVGVPNGGETITVTPNANSIFDLSENVASTSQSNNTAVLHDLRYPYISTQPATDTQAVCKNGTVGQLSVTAWGRESLSFQWYSNTTASNTGGYLISGANSNTYAPAAAGFGTTWYYVQVSMSTGTLASNVSGPIVVDTLPVIKISPDSAIIHLGDAVTLIASGASTYLWGVDNTNPLDHVAAYQMAVGLRRLRSSYNGPALRLRRADDNVEADFGFAGNELDIHAINIFLGVSDGYATILFDQSGIGNNIVQTSPSNQPLFVANGLNGKPVLRFAPGRFMNNPTNFPPPFSVIYVARQTGPSRGRVLASMFNNWLLGWWGGSKTQAHFDGWVSQAGGIAADSNPYIYTGTGNGSTSSIFENGVLKFSNGGGTNGPNGITINGQESSDAEVAELLVFNSVLTNAEREQVENSGGSYYGIFGEAPVAGSARSVSPTVSTLYNVTGYSENGGCAVAKTTLVTVLSNPALAAFPDQNRIYFDGSYTITPPTSNSNGAFTYTSSDTTVATVSGNTVTIVGAGATTIKAIQASTAIYFSDSIAAALTVTSVSVVTKNGALTSTDTGYVNRYGATASGNGLDANGKIVSTKSRGDGLSAATAATSAYQIKQDNPASTDGLYWIKNTNINGGTPFQIYADMTTDGGGWTLILCNTSPNPGWSGAEAILRNELNPGINANYSIIAWADYLKRRSSNFQYMIDAQVRRSNGGIWTANDNYSFVSTSNSNTNITLNMKFGSWNYSDNDIEERMPWYAPGSAGIITTSNDANGSWWGTLIAGGGWDPAPWLGSSVQNPGTIWYWVR